jgi:hypothetical protein
MNSSLVQRAHLLGLPFRGKYLYSHRLPMWTWCPGCRPDDVDMVSRFLKNEDIVSVFGPHIRSKKKLKY